MAYLLHARLFLLTTFMLVLKLCTYPVLGHILGGIEKSSMEDEGARESLNFAVSQYNENNSDLYLSRVLEVKNVQKQVVAGTKFLFDVILVKTNCLKSQNDLTNCPAKDQDGQQEQEFCSFEVYDAPWENDMALISSSCHNI
ncbi:cystatin-S-like [Rattus norvegicus]|uniref:cystatin-S-like n=1 Tax=Rattus norvegicus TaxID=10116 RepID=UPI00001C84A7|nr:cystatin-S-like [Rattus norvegicus]|eukprot:XP_003749635.1 PREDICTED: cystatin-S-like isoform X1 [Rattus norvegicus]